MSKITVACIQTNHGVHEADNLVALSALIRAAAAQGAQLILTPECSDTMIWPASDKLRCAHTQADHPVLQGLQTLAAELGIWLIVGSLAIKEDAGADKMFNRCYVLSDTGQIAAQYDKIHRFDATLSDGESYRESAHFNAGDQAIVANTSVAPVGLSICYDVRFAALYRALAQKGAQILTVPAAFTVPTGKAHWEVLLRARAIETGCFVLAAGQTGTHPGERKTYGHSMIIGPWGEIIADMNDQPGFITATLDLEAVTAARAKLPCLQHDRPFKS